MIRRRRSGRGEGGSDFDGQIKSSFVGSHVTRGSHLVKCRLGCQLWSLNQFSHGTKMLTLQALTIRYENVPWGC